MTSSSTAVFRLQRDVKEVVQRFGFSSENPPLFVATADHSIDHVYALIVGPPDTPYAHGLFLFEVRCSPAYPNEPPLVRIVSTDSGSVRFNPNLYSSGRVCLSILGTWQGERGGSESWRSSYSLGYVLQCIQCIIMNSEPYYNEPGFEKDSVERVVATGSCPAHGFGIKVASSAAATKDDDDDSSTDDEDDEQADGMLAATTDADGASTAAGAAGEPASPVGAAAKDDSDGPLPMQHTLTTEMLPQAVGPGLVSPVGADENVDSALASPQPTSPGLVGQYAGAGNAFDNATPGANWATGEKEPSGANKSVSPEPLGEGSPSQAPSPVGGSMSPTTANGSGVANPLHFGGSSIPSAAAAGVATNWAQVGALAGGGGSVSPSAVASSAGASPLASSMIHAKVVSASASPATNAASPKYQAQSAKLGPPATFTGPGAAPSAPTAVSSAAVIPRPPRRLRIDRRTAEGIRAAVAAAAEAYSHKVRHETLRVTVCDALEAVLHMPRPIPPAATPKQSNNNATGSDAAAAAAAAVDAASQAASVVVTPLFAIPAAAAFATHLKRLFLQRYMVYVDQASNPPQRPAHAQLAKDFPGLTPALHPASAIAWGIPGSDTWRRAAAGEPYADGDAFDLMPFESNQNWARGRFQYRWLTDRLRSIHAALAAETAKWESDGAEATAASTRIASELTECAAAVNASGAVCGAPVSPDNAFTWSFTLMPTEGTYADSVYVVDATFHPEMTEPPRCRFRQPIWHPNVSVDGVPFDGRDEAARLMKSNAGSSALRYSPVTLAATLVSLLSDAPIASPAAVLNPEAAAAAFSSDPEAKKAFRKKARSLSQRTIDG